MARLTIDGMYVNGVPIDDLRGTIQFGPYRVTLTYSEAEALRVELEELQRDMLRTPEDTP